MIQIEKSKEKSLSQPLPNLLEIFFYKLYTQLITNRKRFVFKNIKKWEDRSTYRIIQIEESKEKIFGNTPS